MSTSKLLSSLKLVTKSNLLAGVPKLSGVVLAISDTVIMRVKDDTEGSNINGTLIEAGSDVKIPKTIVVGDTLVFDPTGSAVEHITSAPVKAKPSPARQGSTRIPHNL